MFYPPRFGATIGPAARMPILPFGGSGRAAGEARCGWAVRLDPVRSRALVDTAREALLNVEKHAQAKSVVVTAFATNNGIALAVRSEERRVGKEWRSGWSRSAEKQKVDYVSSESS